MNLPRRRRRSEPTRRAARLRNPKGTGPGAAQMRAARGDGVLRKEHVRTRGHVKIRGAAVWSRVMMNLLPRAAPRNATPTTAATTCSVAGASSVVENRGFLIRKCGPRMSEQCGCAINRLDSVALPEDMGLTSSAYDKPDTGPDPGGQVWGVRAAGPWGAGYGGDVVLVPR